MHMPGEQLLIKLSELLAGGIGTVIRPWVIKREARAEAVGDAEALRIERFAQEQLRQELRDVRAGRKTIGPDFRLIEGPKSGDAPISGEIQQIKANYLKSLQASGYTPQHLIELERQINLDQIASLVIEEAKADEDGTADEKPIDPDWFAQWRNRAQDVSDEDMQRLWARVLKGQAKSTGAYSIHTIEFLSRMSRADAELIAKLGNFALNNRHIFARDSKVLESVGLTLEPLLYLSDLGIISGVTGLQTLSLSVGFEESQVSQWTAVLRCHNKGLIFRAKTADQKQLSIPCYPVSIVGRELLTLADCKANIDYLKEVADSVRDQCDSISIGDVVHESGGQIQLKIAGPF